MWTLPLVIGLVLPLLTSGTAAPYNEYGAFAYSATTHIGVSAKAESRDTARISAEEKCKEKGGGAACQVVGLFRNGYGAFALGSADQHLWGWGTSGDSQREANDTALANCGKGCKIVTQAGTAREGTWAWSSLAPLRGNFYAMGYPSGYRDHKGPDLWAVDFNSDDPAVYPIKAGKVIYQTYNDQSKGPTEYGNTVVIEHYGGLYSIYTHLDKAGLPKLNAEVTPWTKIGTMSDSGCNGFEGCTVHLHFAVHKGKAGLSVSSALFSKSLTAVRTPWYCTTDCYKG
jgi:murein DD-endopeptidase MepM/ murein hydrolase activator NlpD